MLLNYAYKWLCDKKQKEQSLEVKLGGKKKVNAILDTFSI